MFFGALCFLCTSISTSSASAHLSSYANVILMGHGRSGTTFVSEMFRSRPDFWYLYEPLLPFVLPVTHPGALPLGSPMLLELTRRLITCDLDEALMKRLRRNGSVLQMSRQHVRTRLHMNPTLDFDDPAVELPLLDTLVSVRRQCQQHHRMIKTIRLNGMLGKFVDEIVATRRSNLEPVVILHLVRDPRAVINSMLRDKDGGWAVHSRSTTSKDSLAALQHIAQALCAATLDDVQAGARASNNSDKFRYERLIYERIASNPFHEARLLFDEIFRGGRQDTVQCSGSADGSSNEVACVVDEKNGEKKGDAGNFPNSLLPLPALTEKWISENTSTRAGQDRSAALNSHATRRDAAARVDAWRVELSAAEVKAIEATPPCQEVIALVARER